MLFGMCPPLQIVAHHFSDLLMDAKSLITDVQGLSVLFVSQILDST